ncbi:two component transcriptional regulator, LuxR family [Micromonospora nigra]|uniref:Two component transcriptional regulator, LuxR family n=1 Tax=Micromonospora nigra TaxID=145857 RepID=A0A1C6R9I5_9ACTN|nr:response regulator transcription factor [Micromonospora nigra]SCL13741.1 two component transcriptional regulator, LuxR family [Micromonospora nigra]
MQIRVLLADDQPLVRAGIAMLLSAEPDVEIVAEADDGAQAVELSRQLRPDVVLMDVRMPHIDGVAATRALAAEHLIDDPDRPVRIIILTTYHVDEAVHAALRAGASGFVLKDAAPQELVAAVRAVAAGEAWLDPAVTRRLLDDLVTRPDPGLPSPVQMAQLTPREREVLVLMAYGMSNREIAEHLVLGDATVKTHVSRVLMKLGLRDRTHAVVAAYQSRLVQPGTAPPAPARAAGPAWRGPARASLT